jgi:hypothetical protein
MFLTRQNVFVCWKDTLTILFSQLLYCYSFIWVDFLDLGMPIFLGHKGNSSKPALRIRERKVL